MGRRAAAGPAERADPPQPERAARVAGHGDAARRPGEEFDIVLIDAPPLLPVTDGAVLARSPTARCWSCGSHHTREEQLARAAASLAAVDARVLGVVLNMVPAGSGRHTTYGYGSYSTDEHKQHMSRADAARSRDVPLAAAAPAVELAARR